MRRPNVLRSNVFGCVWCVEKVYSLPGEVAAPVYGVTAVDQHLFVVRAWSTDVEVYDCTTYSLLHQLSVPRLLDVTDMTACEYYRCLYLADNSSRAVHTVGTEDFEVTGQWSLADKPYGLSVSGDGHVVISFSETSTVGIFTHAGVLQRRIAVDQVVNLRHAVLLGTGQLVICHGCLQHRAGVSIVDAEGHLLKTLPAEADSQLVWPTHVAVDDRGFIYVVDYSDKRVLQLESDLTYISDIVGYDEGLRNPRSICLDSIRRRLYIAEAGGSVLVFGLQHVQLY